MVIRAYDYELPHCVVKHSPPFMRLFWYPEFRVGVGENIRKSSILSLPGCARISQETLDLSPIRAFPNMTTLCTDVYLHAFIACPLSNSFWDRFERFIISKDIPCSKISLKIIVLG